MKVEFRIIDNFYKCWKCDCRDETVISVDLGEDVGYYCSECREEMIEDEDWYIKL